MLINTLSHKPPQAGCFYASDIKFWLIDWLIVREIRWFKIYGICKIQASKHTHALRNEVTLVWGSLRLAPIKILTACVSVRLSV